MRTLRSFAVALVAASTLTTALVGTTSAVAAPGASGVKYDKTGTLVDAQHSPAAFSPNRDQVKDRARVAFTLKKKSTVTVQVRKYSTGDLVFVDKAGKLARGKHTWRWDGTKLNGSVVRDGRYSVAFFADPVAPELGTRYDVTILVADTVYERESLEVSSPTVYPNTTVITDQVAFNHGGWWFDYSGEQVGKVTLVVTNSAGEVVRSKSDPYKRRRHYYPVTWDGRDDAGNVLPAGQYRARFKVTDWAGNKGTSRSLPVTVSAAPLVMASGSRTVPPTTGVLPTTATATVRTADGRPSMTGGDDYVVAPCGTVVASQVYSDQGAASYRSADTCVSTSHYERPHVATRAAEVSLADLDAPRGLASAWLSMRGRPTVDGETDTAELSFGFTVDRSPAVSGVSAAVAGESVTTTPLLARSWDATRYQPKVGVHWAITSRGADWYDVAAVTVDYTYLTPQAS